MDQNSNKLIDCIKNPTSAAIDRLLSLALGPQKHLLPQNVLTAGEPTLCAMEKSAGNSVIYAEPATGHLLLLHIL